jgi:hypothetical protein
MSRATAEDRIIALSAGTAARREAARAQAAALLEALDWQRLVELLGVRRLLPTLGPRILELAGASAPERFQEAVAESLKSGRRQGAFLQLIAGRLIDALAAAGIRSTALKGALLGELLYGDPGRRQSSDIDLLVAAEELGEAVAVVRQLGYAAPVDPVDGRGLPLLHFALIHEREALPPVELHWRVHWYEARFAHERLLAPDAGSAAGWRPPPVYELAAMLLFYARDGFIGLRHAADLAAWWDAFGEGLSPAALSAVIAGYPALGPVLATAATVAERTVGLPASRLLGGGARLRIRDRVAVRLAEPYPHSSEAQIYADMGLIDGLLAPSGGLRDFLRRQLVPPVREGAGRDGARRTPSAVGYRARVLGRYGLAMSRLLQVREGGPWAKRAQESCDGA